MAKVFVAYCDACDREDVRTEAITVTVTLDNGKPLELDLCEIHNKELIAPLRELLSEVGQPTGKQPALTSVAGGGGGGEKKQCPTCAPEVRLLTREGLRGHMRKLHDMDRADANEVVRNVFGNDRALKPFSEKCPECEAEGTLLDDQITYDTPQGLGAHRRSVHGVEGTGRK